jgi:hypothetical protein
MRVEARCPPCHSAAHRRHMKRQPCLCHHHPRRGRCHCDCHRHLHCCCQLRHHRRCHCPLPSPSAIAVAVNIDHCRRRLYCVVVSHCHPHCRCPHRRPLPSPSPLAITVAISIGHQHHHCHQPFPRVVALVRRDLYSTNQSKECSPYLFCLDSGQRTDQSRMTDQVLSGNGQHQHWAASGKQCAASEGSGWQQGGSRGAAGWRR